jgi:D-glycero-D-manno-heptose 1,7-bisphosphate phosphatase
MPKQKAVFLDRDGVINEEIGDYVYRPEDFRIVDGIIEVLKAFKEDGYRLIVVTNQAGIAKGRYTREDMHRLHEHFQAVSGELIDHFYFAANHPSFSESLLRKPDSLMWEKAIARFDIDPTQSWMVGDKERDLIPADKLGIQTIRIFIEGYYQPVDETIAKFSIHDVKSLPSIILNK